MGSSSSDQGLVEQASTKVQDVASTAQEKAGELTEKGRGRLAGQLDDRTTQAGSQIKSVAQSLRESTDKMRDDGNSNAANVAGQAADQIDKVGSYLEDKGGDDILRDVEDFARTRPWMLAGLSLLAGIALARFLKASSEQRYSSAYPSRQFGRGARGYPGSSPYAPYGADTPATIDEGLYDASAPLARDPLPGEPHGVGR